MTEASADVEAHVDELLRRMSVAEKVGQLNMPFPVPPEIARVLELTLPGTDEDYERFVLGEYHPRLGPGGGFFQLVGRVPGGPRQQAEAHNRLQHLAQAQTSHGIPLLQIAEGTHGVVAGGATVFPEGPALGSSWDDGLVERVYAAVAREARAVGVHLLCTLVVEPTRDPRLGRNCEGYSEDPFLVAALARAIVAGAQGTDVDDVERAGTVLCAFPCQSEPLGGLERGAMPVSERTLRDVFLPPWRAGITDAGAVAVMATYATIDGVPTHGSRWLLTDVLRDELGFEGIVLSEGLGFESLQYEGIVATQAEAGAMAIEAGVDVNITYEAAYLEPLIDQVESGAVPIALLDRAVRRVLILKHKLGLFADPYVDPDRAAAVVHCADHVELALEAARAGIVLLKNEGDVLPLAQTVRRLAVIGPNAHAPGNQLGDYTIAGYVGESTHLPPITTVLDGIIALAGDRLDVVNERGCGVVGDDAGGFEAAIAAARDADVAIVVVGEQQGTFIGVDDDALTTVGEDADVATLELTGVQDQLVRAIHGTGTPTVVVLINGRPLATRWIADHVPAVVEAWLPGERGGQAVAEVLFGVVNPSGRLPVTVPRHVGQLPVYYNHPLSKGFDAFRTGKAYVEMPIAPLYEFGFGLTYTTFAYTGLDVDPPIVAADGQVRVAVQVTNVGQRPGTETVQLYIRDVLASIAPPVKQLRGFAKVALVPGETATVEFSLGPDHLAMLDGGLRRVVEPGEFELQVGASSKDIRLRASLMVDGGA